MESKRNLWLLPTNKPSRLFKDDFGKYFISINIDQEQNHFKPHNLYITSDEEIKEGDWVLGNFPDNPIGKVISKYGEEFTAQSLNGDKYGLAQYDSQKIILTTDQDLINDGVQAIDDEFLEWFVKNPSCESVETVFNNRGITGAEKILKTFGEYKIIIPKEEPKLINNCPKCGLDLIEREGSKPICTDIDCRGIILSSETLREWASKEELKQETLEEAVFKRHPRSLSAKDAELRNEFLMGAKWQAERMYSEEEVERIANDAYNVGKHGGINETYYDFKEWFEQLKKK